MKKTITTAGYSTTQSTRLSLRFTGWLFAFLSLFVGIIGNAQTATIGTGAAVSGTNDNGNPIYRSSATSAFHYSKSVQLLTTADLSTATVPSGSVINQISYFKNSAFNVSGTNNFTLNVYLKNSSKTILASGTAWDTMTSGATLFYTGTINSSSTNFTATADWVNLANNSGNTFIYLGGAIEVYIDWAPSGTMTSPFTGGSFLWKYDTLTPATASQAIGTSNSTPIPGTQAAYTAQSRRYQTKLVYSPAPACTGTPTAGTVTSPLNACSGTPITLSTTGGTSGVSGLTYQWYSSPAGANTWTAIAGATTPSYNITAAPNTATDYHLIVTCTPSGQSNTSGTIAFVPNPYTSCYCTSTATTAADEDIVQVKFGSLDNSSDCTTVAPGAGSVKNMYSNFLGVTAPNIEQAVDTPIQVKVGYCGSSTYSNTVVVYIDLNQNGQFEANEKMYTSTYGAGTVVDGRTVLGNINIPPTSTPGLTRMRVIVNEADLVTPACGTYSYGETEDYMINILAASGCTGTPSAGSVTSPLNACIATPIVLTTTGSTSGVAGLTYQWYSSPAGANTWTAITGATTASYTVTSAPVTATDYHLIVTCTNSTQTNTSATISYIPNPFSSCYCTSSATNASDEDIFQVKMGSLDNNSDCTTVAPGTGSVINQYSNYTDLTPTDLNQAVDIPFQVKVGYCGSFVYSNMVSIFIDLNKNGQFEANENMFTSTYASGTLVDGRTITGNINIPTTSMSGETRMRIIAIESNTPPNPCGTYGYGETEDYVVNIIAATGCTGTPTAGTVTSPLNSCGGQPLTLTTTGASSGTSGLTYQWSSSPAGANTWTAITGANTPSYTVAAAPTVATDYHLVVTCTNSNQSNTSATIAYIPNPPTQCYCTPAAPTSGCSGDNIGSVTLGTLSDTGLTCTPFYEDRMSAQNAIPSIQQSSTPSMSVEVGTGGTEQVGVWIDYNQNGSFDDAGEFTALGSANGATVTNTISVPSGATLGDTRMRVRSRYSTAISNTDACTTFSYGTTRDYKVTIVANSSVSDVRTKEAIAVYPNPFADVLTISDVSKVKSITVTDASGKLVKSYSKAESKLNLSGLASGLYMVTLNNVDGTQQTIKAIKK